MDRMGLLEQFSRVYPEDEADLFVVGMTPSPRVGVRHVVDSSVNDMAFLGRIAGSRRAVVAMGMIVFELVYLGIQTHCFNATDLHLLFSQGMARHGLIKAWPEVGLPGDEEFKDFLSEPFEITGRGPDLRGAARVMREIERR